MLTYYTHAGRFHCDEVTGYAITRLAGICKRFERLTDLNNIQEDGLVADIGRVYDPRELRYDHHQEFLKREDGYPYATAGLLWKEYGWMAVSVLTGLSDREQVDKIVDRVDNMFIKAIDANDADTTYSVRGECWAGPIQVTTLPMVISILNNPGPDQEKSFAGMVHLVELLLIKHILQAAAYFQNIEKFVQLAVRKIYRYGVAILSERIEWFDFIHEHFPDIRFVIAPSDHPGNPYSLTAVTKSPDTREVWCPIERPEWFTGFIHQGKWIAGAKTAERLERLAKWNLEL